MNTKNTQDPWLGGQKQIKFPIPGWIVFLVKAPFRLLFGLLGATRSVNNPSLAMEEENKRYIGDAQYYQEVELYGRSDADFRVLNNIK